MQPYKIYMRGFNFAYELESVARQFTPLVRAVEGEPEKHVQDYVYLRRYRLDSCVRLTGIQHSYWERSCKTVELAPEAGEADCEFALAGLLYDLLFLPFGVTPPWGILTGIRPAKIASGMLDAGLDARQVRWRLSSQWRVAADKADLALRTARNAAPLTDGTNEKSFSLYISIPFCPSRCSYCSFISKTQQRDRTLTAAYLETLCAELEQTAALAAELGLRLESVYIGGGTPTVLEAAELERLCGAVNRYFDPPACGEFTVEAGRPDTITPQKLAALRAAGVTRVSVNPQTANDAVLRAIGRRHTAQDTLRAYEQARAAGFPVINMDLIAGLPADDLESFARTLDWVFALDPENITLHALTLKRAAALRDPEGGRMPPSARNATAMVARATEAFAGRGYAPYYMYKQKGTVEGLENTGYARPATECRYNVFMMDERHTILSCGAGAVTKLVSPRGLIKRVYNYKYPAEYLRGFETITKRKDSIRAFYESAV